MKLIRYSLIALCVTSLLLTGCSQGIKDEVNMSGKTATTGKRSGAMLNYSLHELKEIDLTNRQADEEDSNIDIWQKITDGYQFNQPINSRIQNEINFYHARPKTIPEALRRASPYLYMITHEIQQRNMPMEIAFLPIIESSFNTKALSSANASGMWQFTPDTAQVRGLKNDWWYDGRRDVYESTVAALDLLQSLYGRLDNDWMLALAAYNWGALNVKAAVAKNKAKGLPTDYWNLKMPTETMRYVPKLLAVAEMVKSAPQYKIALPNIPNTPLLTRIQIDQQIDLSTAAQMADMSWDDFHRINAGHKRITTNPNEKTHVVVPVDKLSTFAINLTRFAPQTNGKWISYTLTANDTLADLAKRHNTTPEILSRINQLSYTPKAGQTLLIPVDHQQLDENLAATADTSLKTTLALESREIANARALAERKEVLKKQKITHKLRNNQPLSKVAEYYGVSLRALALVNNLTPQSKLKVGQELIIPVEKVISVTAKKGDTWQSIAKQNRVPAHVLLSFNNAKEKDALKPGQAIKVPKMG
ncbi:MAG: LysM peptidoglycan-binding domain-containing protein [Thiotrichales bacterium]|nr:MAG: LysM peptidoglycan-binding domain-containing protein [Thiotrichales bacterium]